VGLDYSPISGYERALDLKDAVSGREKRIKTYYRSLRVGWSPDSRAFYMNDAFASDREDAYLYWVDKTKAQDLGDLILRRDQEARQLGADHQYFHVYRWADAGAVEVEYCGHTSNAPVRRFDFLYRVGLGQPVADFVRISGEVRPVANLFSEECRY